VKSECHATDKALRAPMSMIPLRIYLYAALLAALAGGIWYYGHTRYAAGELAGNVKVAHLTAQHAQEAQHVADLTVVASEAARNSEHKQALALDAIAAQYEQDKNDAQAAADRTIADLRAGNVRLRRRWACPPSASMPGTSASTAQSDADAADREASAARIIHAAADADNQIKRLQDTLRDERKL
jgi:hypothetical protein